MGTRPNPAQFRILRLHAIINVTDDYKLRRNSAFGDEPRRTMEIILRLGKQCGCHLQGGVKKTLDVFHPQLCTECNGLVLNTRHVPSASARGQPSGNGWTWGLLIG